MLVLESGMMSVPPLALLSGPGLAGRVGLVSAAVEERVSLVSALVSASEWVVLVAMGLGAASVVAWSVRQLMAVLEWRALVVTRAQ